MQQDKLTDRSQGFIQSAQNLAVRESNQFLTPEHLFKVLLDDKEGMAASLLASAGVDVAHVRHQVAEDVSKLPKVHGASVQVSANQAFMKVLDSAESLATKAGDSYVTVERLLQALVMHKSYGIDAKKLNEVINEMRGGRTATSATAEDNFDKKICHRLYRTSQAR